MSAVSSWRLAVRLARREAVRARGRSVLVLVMIALPVLAVTAADVVVATQDVDSVESLDRRLGAADARLSLPSGGRPVQQLFDPDDGNTWAGGRRADRPSPPSPRELSEALGGARLLAERTGEVTVRTDHGVGVAGATEIDLRDPLADGLFRVTSGRLPARPGEVVANQALLDRGYAVGDRLMLVDDRTADLVDAAEEPTIVGVAESAETRDWPTVAGPIGSLALRSRADAAWLVEGGPVDWHAVRQLNELGVLVLSRAVIEDPPPDSEIPAEVSGFGSGDDTVVVVVALVVAMALLEVVLLAGPAFAVGARRQARDLAMIAAAGGTPRQSRRVVLASGIVLGGLAAVAGVLLGIGAGWALVPVAQHWSGSWFGPFDIPWPHLVGIAGFGVLSALLAAVVPAWVASRQDVVAVLAGRRADRRPSVRSPLLGVVLLACGVAGSAYGASRPSDGELAIAGSAVVSVLGMILLVPVAVVLVARLAGRLPLPVRYAVRDAARHRTRTVPAVAAVAATVAGVVALGIGTSSDAAESEGIYTPSLPIGDAAVTAYGADPQVWPRILRQVRAALPDAEVVSVRGVAEGPGPGRRSAWVELAVPGDRRPLLTESSSSFGASVLVADRMPTVLQGVAETDRARATQALASGAAVVFTDHPVEARSVRVRAAWSDRRHPRSHPLARTTVPAVFARFQAGRLAAATAVLPSRMAERLGLEASTVGVGVTGADISPAQETDLGEAVAAISPEASFYVERGYRPDASTVIVQWVLGALGAVLMLGGTLTATFLALSDARPDLATLAAVGASPRRRRGIAASYALVVGLVGAVLGAAVGFVPGIAVSYPLTRGYDEFAADHYLDIPWLLIVVVVVGLPVLTAAVVGLSARSRLPMVARLP